MKNKVFFPISIRIVILFGTGMMFTFIPDNLREFFGDEHHETCSEACVPTGYSIKKCSATDDIDKRWDWGARHYWCFWCGVTLFLLSVANLIVSIEQIISKNYEDEKE